MILSKSHNHVPIIWNYNIVKLITKKERKMEEIYADTIVGINFNNGVVKIVLANQDLENVLSEDNSEAGEVKMKSNRVINMSLPGFLYSASVIDSLLKDPKMIKTIEAYTKAGILKQEEPKAKSKSTK
jgi:hypothetical protein